MKAKRFIVAAMLLSLINSSFVFCKPSKTRSNKWRINNAKLQIVKKQQKLIQYKSNQNNNNIANIIKVIEPNNNDSQHAQIQIEVKKPSKTGYRLAAIITITGLTFCGTSIILKLIAESPKLLEELRTFLCKQGYLSYCTPEQLCDIHDFWAHCPCDLNWESLDLRGCLPTICAALPYCPEIVQWLAETFSEDPETITKMFM